MQVVIFSSPNREEMICNLLREFQAYDVAIIGDADLSLENDKVFLENPSDWVLMEMMAEMLEADLHN